MTREEQIKQYCADQGFPYGACSSLSSMKAQIASEAIRWADKTIKERVLDFIDTYFYDHPLVNVRICSDSFESLEDMKEELKKAIDE